MPREELEETSATQFNPTIGAPAKPVRLAFGALLIKHRLGQEREGTSGQWSACLQMPQRSSGDHPPDQAGPPSHCRRLGAWRVQVSLCGWQPRRRPPSRCQIQSRPRYTSALGAGISGRKKGVIRPPAFLILGMAGLPMLTCCAALPAMPRRSSTGCDFELAPVRVLSGKRGWQPSGGPWRCSRPVELHRRPKRPQNGASGAPPSTIRQCGQNTQMPELEAKQPGLTNVCACNDCLLAPRRKHNY